MPPTLSHMSAEGTSWSELTRHLAYICRLPCSIPRFFPDYVPSGQGALFEKLSPQRFFRGLSLSSFQSAIGVGLRPGVKMPPVHGVHELSGLNTSGSVPALPIALLRPIFEAIHAQVHPGEGSWEEKNLLLHRPLTSGDKVRQRFIPSNPVCPEIFGPRFSCGIAVYLAILPVPEQQTLLLWLELFKPYVKSCFLQSALVEIFKALEGWAKINGDLFQHWKVLCGLALLGDYVPAPPLDAFAPDVREWVSGPLPGIGLRAPGWRDAFAWAAAQFADECEPAVPELSYDDYVLSGHWIRQGTTDQGVFPTVMYGRERVGIRRNKDAMFYASTPEQLLAIAYSPAGESRAMVKRELTKARAVVITDTPSYLRMSWLSTALEPALKRAKSASVYFSGKRLSDMWSEIALQGDDPALWKCPIDQSGFDHMVEPWMIRVVLGCIGKLLIGDEAHRVLQLIYDDLLSPTNHVVVGSHRILVEKGVLSGWRWTALIDTWVNFSQVVGSLKLLHSMEVVSELNWTGWYFQGDDARLVVRNPAIAVAVAEVMRFVGLRIHPSKTWLSPFRDEYLRQVSQGGTVSGYLCRSVPAILWRNPINQSADDWSSATRAAVSRWDGLVNRGASVPAVARLCLREVARLCPLPGPQVMAWLTAPTWRGGLEVTWLPVTSPIIEVHVTQPTYDLAVSRLPMIERAILLVPGYDPQMLRSKALEYVRATLDPFLSRRVFQDADSGVPFVIPSLPIGMSPPLGRVPIGAPPAAARWRLPTPFPNWYRQVLVSAAIETRNFEPVLSLLTPVSHDYGYAIVKTHGRSTWADWMLGALDLPVRRALRWDVGFLGSQLRSQVVRFVRCYLSSSLRWGRTHRLASRRYFWSCQRPPSSLYTYVISG